MYLVKTLSAWATFKDQILNDQELKEYKSYAKDQQLLLEIEEISND
tara:strand:- start:242 stop:379 length:138 start_codon:yes stop_codon:yes gene_type:complete